MSDMQKEPDWIGRLTAPGVFLRNHGVLSAVVLLFMLFFCWYMRADYGQLLHTLWYKDTAGPGEYAAFGLMILIPLAVVMLAVAGLRHALAVTRLFYNRSERGMLCDAEVMALQTEDTDEWTPRYNKAMIRFTLQNGEERKAQIACLKKSLPAFHTLQILYDAYSPGVFIPEYGIASPSKYI